MEEKFNEPYKQQPQMCNNSNKYGGKQQVAAVVSRRQSNASCTQKQETLHTVNVNEGRKKEVKEFKNDSTLRPVFHFKLHSC